MHYQKYHPIDVVNGPGTRCTLFVSGCVHKCPGCYNASTWNANSGHPFTPALADRIVADLQDAQIPRRGLTLSGGDPLYPGNCPSVQALVRRVKAECPGKDIWLWTGYVLEALDCAQRAVLPYIDVLVDGPFVQALADRRLQLCGSSNQRIIPHPARRLGEGA